MTDVFDKLRQLDAFMRYEPAEETRSGLGAAPDGFDRTCGDCCAPDEPGSLPRGDYAVYPAVMPGGQRLPLLKTLLTSACERDCNYCCFRAGRDFRRTTMQPEELAKAFMQLNAAGIARGLFLSSGVAGGGVRTQDRLIAAAEILRFKLGFRGYLHLKIMPGADRAQVERAMQLADRVSVNLEAPNSTRLAGLAPHKIFMEELVRPLKWVEEIRRSQPPSGGWNGRWPSTTTQFVVGGAGETDLELLATTAELNKNVHIARAYYSGFKPVSDTPLQDLPAANPWREHRLYQASFLLRDYGFDLEELPFRIGGDLPLDADPKLAWARENLSQAPMEINHANLHELMRVPGIGPKGARAILVERHKNRIKQMGDLRRLGVLSLRAAPFILLDGKRPALQLSLWD